MLYKFRENLNLRSNPPTIKYSSYPTQYVRKSRLHISCRKSQSRARDVKCAFLHAYITAARYTMFKRGQYLESIEANRADIRSELKRFAQNGESFLRLISLAEQKCIFFAIINIYICKVYNISLYRRKSAVYLESRNMAQKHHSSMFNM